MRQVLNTMAYPLSTGMTLNSGVTPLLWTWPVQYRRRAGAASISSRSQESNCSCRSASVRRRVFEVPNPASMASLYGGQCGGDKGESPGMDLDLAPARWSQEPILDHAFDCHTRDGKAAGTTKQQFFVEEHDGLKHRQLGLFDQDLEVGR